LVTLPPLQVVVLHVLDDDLSQVLLAERDDAPQALVPDGSNEPLPKCDARFHAHRAELRALGLDVDLFAELYG
jgi:hypothetical protein